MNDRLPEKEEIYIKGSEINKIYLKIYRATCKITVTSKKNRDKGYGTGFFMKLNIHNFVLNCLITAEHVIVNKDLGPIEDIIRIDYDDEWLEIKLDQKKRFIKGFKKGFNNENSKESEDIDIILIEIIKSYNKDKYFLTEYINKEECIENKEIHIIQFPNGETLSESKGKIKEIKEYNFSHKSRT